MKISEYEKVTSMEANDVFLINTGGGTKKIEYDDLKNQILKKFNDVHIHRSYAHIHAGRIEAGNTLLLTTAQINNTFGVTDPVRQIVSIIGKVGKEFLPILPINPTTGAYDQEYMLQLLLNDDGVWISSFGTWSDLHLYLIVDHVDNIYNPT